MLIVTLKSKAKTVPNSLIVNEIIITNKSSVAEILSHFFVNVGSNLASKISKAKKRLIHLKMPFQE